MRRLTPSRRTLAAGVGAAAAALVALLPASASAITDVDLSSYARVGRYDLPEPTRTAAPPGNLLAQEVSAVTYDRDTDTLFVVGDGGTAIVQVDKTGNLVDTMTLAAGSSPQGTEFYDPEGLAYVGGGRFVMTEERDRRVVRFTYAAGTTLTRAQTETVALGTFVPNIGLEGVGYDPATSSAQDGPGLVLVKETQPEGVFQTNVDFAAGTATNGSATTENSANLFDPALAGLSDLADVFALSNVASLTGPQSDNLLLLSQEDGRIVNVDRSGAVASQLTIQSDPGNPLAIADQQHEGLAMDDDGTLYVVSENGGGDVNHPQLWVYERSSVPNQAPTAVTLANQVGSIAENTSTASRIRVADIAVADDGLGTNALTVSGPDAASFEVVGSALYLRAGTVLDFEARASYGVTVNVDDASVGPTPDASAAFTLSVTDVVNENPAGAPLVVSEVAPWASGNASYGVDWFEVTNTGATAVDVTGWRMDDSSNAFGSAVPLRGVTSIPAGGSAIFMETGATDVNDAAGRAAFSTAWFGTATPPAGVQIGFYGGSGVGLSTGGDAVNVFDAAGARQAGVAFGASPATGPFATFDNAAGASSATLPLPTISLLSASGANGAFTAADGQQVGSPGTTAARVAVTEAAPWASGANSPYGVDWIEVTNTGALPVDLTGWRMDDSSNTLAAAVPMRGVTTIPAGRSAVLMEGEASGSSDAALLAAFSTAWYGTPAPPAGVQVGFYGGGGVGLSTGGDGVNLFDGAGSRVTGIAFPSATTFFTFDNAGGLGTTGTAAPAQVTTLSSPGVNGAFVADHGQENGSPGVIAAPRQVVSEVAPWASGNSPYEADWFEVTNPGPVPVNLTGWRMDDGSAAFASAVPLRGVAQVPAGGSALFMEGRADGATDAALGGAFSTAWFGSPALPPGVRLGFYGGSGVGLSTGGDAVNLYDAAGAQHGGVTFGASPASAPFATFDNTAGAADVATLSAGRVNGAFLAADGAEVGSPGPDLVGPVITGMPADLTAEATGPDGAAVGFAAPSASEPGDGALPVTCTPASGGTFPLGATTVTCSAADTLGNPSSRSFTVTVADTTAPSITAPADVTVDAVAPSGTAVAYGAPQASDAVGVVSSGCAPAGGSTFAIGTTTVTCTASDAAGHTATATFTVTVRGAADQIRSLRTRVTGLPALQTRRGRRTAALLVDPLDDALAALQRRPWRACVALWRFEVLVGAHRGRHDGDVPRTDAAALVQDARRIRTVIGCRLPGRRR